jgi:hypothetical protein
VVIYLTCGMLVYLMIGALLAQRYKVLVLLPAIVFAALFAIMLGYHHGATHWQIVGTVIAGIVCLQFGYLAGAGINYLLTAGPAGLTDHHTLHGSHRPTAN